jgi:apolipoprotein D and lipocalin family protein
MDRDLPPQPIVNKVEIPRFMGKWYVIANIPTMFEKNAYNATETYSWNSEKSQIDIDFKFNKNGFDGPVKSIPQKAFIFDDKTKAEWRVQPFWPLKFAYLIVDLADDYSDTIIGVPSRNHVWIMARTPQIPADRYARLVEKTKSLGYDIAKLEKVPQRTH